MSIVTVTAIHDLAGHEAYVGEGRGEKRREHLADGTDRRAPGTYSDMPREEFVALGQQLARDHGRRVQAIGYVVAWAPDELSVANDDDLRIAGDYAYILAKTMHPHSPVSVAVHADAVGGHVHAHLAVLSHDFDTGRALIRYRRHREVAALNDELSREHGLRVIEPKPKVTTLVALPFDDMLRGRIADALADPDSLDWAAFAVACEARGVEVVTTMHTVASDGRRGRRRGENTVGVTYRACDDTGAGKARVRRRKASSLGREYTYDGILTALTAKQPSPVSTPVRAVRTAAVPARGRSELVGLMTDVLARGVFAVPGMPGYARAALELGVRVMRSRQRAMLTYGFDGEPERWGEHELPQQLRHASVTGRLAEVAKLRAIAPKDTSDMPVFEVVEILTRQLDDDEAAAPHTRRRRRALLPDLPPLAERHAELSGLQRTARNRDRALGR